jgi:arylsulfatase A-like enzyme
VFRLICIASLIVAGACACSPKLPEGRAKRVIVISCDTLRADRLGAYGYARPTSPEFDALAREALIFDNAFAMAPWTGPSVSSMLTGRLPDEIGVSGGNRFPLPPAALTLAELARESGFGTAAIISNWVLRRPDPSLGDAGIAQGFTHFDQDMQTPDKNREGHFERVAPDTLNAALRWLDDAKQHGKDRFFLYVHFQDPHGPYTPPVDLAQGFARPSLGEPALAVGTTNKGRGQIPRYQALAGLRDPEAYRALYDAEVRAFDRALGRLVAWLRQNGWLDDALLIVTADHGESLGEHDYWFCHGENVQREVVRVPFLVRFPRGAQHVAARTEGGYQRVAELSGHLDVWPTVIEALGLPPHAARGLSLFSKALPTTRILAQSMGAAGAPNRFEAFNDERWRLVLEPSGLPKLYDWQADPREEHDLAASERARVEDLMARYQSFLSSAGGTSLPGQAAALDQAEERAMRNLGYTEGEH